MKRYTLIIGLALCLISPPVYAGISSLTNVSVIAAPSSVEKNVLVGSPASLFAEQLSHETTTDLTVDITADGTYTLDPGDANFPSGQTIDSYYLHFDMLSISTFQTSGSITFDGPILAIMGNQTNLTNSHSELGAAGTTYWAAGTLAGVWDSAADSLTLNGNTLDFTLEVGTAIDSVRILVAVIPEPTSLMLLGIGIIGLVGYRRRR